MKFERGDLVIGTSYYKKKGMGMSKYFNKYYAPYKFRTICRYLRMDNDGEYLVNYIRDDAGQTFRHGYDLGTQLYFGHNELKHYIESENVRKVFGDILNEI